MAGEASCIIHSLDRHVRPPQAKCKELAGPRVDGHMGETGLLIHLFFHNTSGVFKLHTPLGTGDIVKTERVPKTHGIYKSGDRSEPNRNTRHYTFEVPRRSKVEAKGTSFGVTAWVNTCHTDRLFSA